MKNSKVLSSLKDAIAQSELKNGMTLSFHHHLRNGDYVLNSVIDAAAEMGFKDLCVNASALFDVHAPLLEHLRSGVVSRLETNYMSGLIGRAVSQGLLAHPVIFRTHGGRPSDIETGRSVIDVAFIAAPASDPLGNATGTKGPSACGSLGYAVSDAQNARHVVVVTDTLLPYPLEEPSIEESCVDSVVVVPSIGDPAGIVSGTTRITRDPVGLAMADQTVQLIEASGLLTDGFSFQTGAGGASLAVAHQLKDVMLRRKITGSFALGGITGYLVDLLETGCFQSLLDVQCFDLKAVQSIGTNKNHQEISALRYAGTCTRSSAVDQLDVGILGATEIDLDFNVNVHTDSSGFIMGGSGGHSDVAAGAKMAVVIAPLIRARLPLVVNRVTCCSTPGNTIDVLVTQKGIAVNPSRPDLKERFIEAGLPLKSIEELQALAHHMTGVPQPLPKGSAVVGHVLYRDGSLLDRLHVVAPTP